MAIVIEESQQNYESGIHHIIKNVLTSIASSNENASSIEVGFILFNNDYVSFMDQESNSLVKIIGGEL